MEVERDWWTNPLASEICAYLLKRENEVPNYFAQSPQLSLRRYLVDWLAIVCGELDICVTAHHLAVYLMDYFMDRFDIEEQQLHLVAIGCLLVAAKYEEQDPNIPKASTLNQYVLLQNRYSLAMYMQMELALLQTFQWNIGLTTPAHLVEYYLTEAVGEKDLHGNRPISSPEKAKCYMKKYTGYFLEISLQDHAFRKYKASNIAAGCIAASRICLHLSPTWPPRLKEITGYDWEVVSPCVDLMLKAHQIDEQASRTQSDSIGDVSIQASVTITPVTTPSTYSTINCTYSSAPYMCQATVS